MMSKAKKVDQIKKAKEWHPFSHALTDEERRVAANSLAKTLSELEDVEKERKVVNSSFKTKYDGLKRKIAYLGSSVLTGEDQRSIECTRITNYTKGTMVLIRVDTGQVVEERSLSNDEKQMEFDDNTPLEE
jgi:hypothetical protein